MSIFMLDEDAISRIITDSDFFWYYILIVMDNPEATVRLRCGSGVKLMYLLEQCFRFLRGPGRRCKIIDRALVAQNDLELLQCLFDDENTPERRGEALVAEANCFLESLLRL